jgi:amidohydrolase
MINLEQEIADLTDELISIRRWFHKHPELGFNEHETSARIAGYLRDYGLEVTTGIGKTGVVALLKGEIPGKTIGIRADIDALPIEENTDLDFSSNNKGVMHACGHDSHITIGLGTAKVLSRFKSKLQGNVVFIFQPAEELLTGAKAMIDDGLFNKYKIDAIIGLHNWPGLDSGIIGIKSGPIMAAVDKFEVSIKGMGGHGAIPQKAVDPIVMVSEIILAFQKIVSREIDPLEAAVLTVGTINGGTAFNIIPDQVQISGTVRTFKPRIRKYIPERMEEIVAGITKGDKGEYDFNYDFGIPATINDEQFTTNIEKKLISVLGEKKVKNVNKPSMGGEDFSLYLEQVPGTYFFLGTRNKEDGLIFPIHHNKFSIDEKILPLGVRAFCEIALSYLNNEL